MLMAMPVNSRDKEDSILGAVDLRPQIYATIDKYLLSQMPYGTMRLYDSSEDRVLRMEIRALDEDIIRKGEFYVNCLTFVDQDGRKLDVDLLVPQNEEPLQVTQAVIHKIDGSERRYNLGSERPRRGWLPFWGSN
jgi:hypothetical protein